MAELTLAAVLVAPETFEMRELPIPPIGDDAAILAGSIPRSRQSQRNRRSRRLKRARPPC